MTKIRDIIQYMESIAPSSYQEGYDNVGLLVGYEDTEVKGINIALDCTEEVIDETIAKKCNLVLCHHPILFKGLKKITGKSYIERVIIKAIQNNIGIAAFHTNLDNVAWGVNKKIAELIGLVDMHILSPKKKTLSKLTFFVPEKNTDQVLDALHKAGAGQIGNYSNCSFKVSGIGAFKPNQKANPHIGEKDSMEYVEEHRVEVIFSSYLENKIINKLKEVHPYEEVAYYLHLLENKNQEVGSGLIGELPKAVDTNTFLALLKEKMHLSCIRHTYLMHDSIKKIAICGGAGSFLLSDAIAKKADIFITADFKYHEFFDAENKIIIADIGHYESEVCTKDLIHEFITKKFTNIAAYMSKVNTNPISYL